MAENLSGWTLGELAQILGARLEGDPAVVVVRPVEAGSSDPQGITFAEGPKFYERVRGSNVGVVILSEEAPDLGLPTLRLANPRVAFGQVLNMAQAACPVAVGVHPSAVVDPSATIHPGARIGAQVSVGPRCVVGEGTILFPNVTLVQDVVIGAHCQIHSGAVIGAPGFGYAFDGRHHQPIPQVGGVIIEDRVDIGANTCIDRATAGNTVIGEGTKIDNLCQIAHNVRIGQNTVIAGICALAGSVTIGNYVVVGGQTSFKDHVTVADGVQIGGRTDVASDITERGAYWGPQQLPIKTALRVSALMKRLPELFERLKELERK